LTSKKDFSLIVEDQEDLVKTIQQQEKTFQTMLNDRYQDLLNNKFKSLRRVLPITRSKIDWDKISNYKIGSELGTSSKPMDMDE